jgi:hypothetical protein
MVTFKEGNLLLGIAPVDSSGMASLSPVSLLTPGSHTITASYSGDANFSVSTSSGTANAQLTVGQAATTVMVSTSPSFPTPGQTVTFRATVAPTAPGRGVPSGTVTFQDGSTTLGTALVNDQGVAVFSTSSLSLGSHIVTASYAGDPRFSTISGMTTVTVVQQNAAWIASAYQALLGRPPEQAAQTFLLAAMSEGFTRAQLAFFIQLTPEFLTREAEDAYQATLHRAADPGGLSSAFQFLATGHTVEQLKAILLGSTEYFQNNGQGTNNGFLGSLYNDALGRPIDSTGQANATQQLGQGVSRTEIALGVLTSMEGFTVFGKNAYQQMLNRAADSAGLNTLVTFMSSDHATDTLVAAILVGSDEFFNLS